jgi:hypothetical protein
LGHALHFLLSATAAGASAGDCGCWAGLDLCEVTSHVTERTARDARCLQVSKRKARRVRGSSWCAGAVVRRKCHLSHVSFWA